MSQPFLTLGQTARIIEARHPGNIVPLWRLRRLYERRLLPEPARVGQNRVVRVEEVVALEAALISAGYLRDAAEVPA